MTTILDFATTGRVIQLGQLIDGQPTKNPPVPDFEQRLYATHDPAAEEMPGAYPGVTGASDTIFMSTHSGTHMDSLAHIAHNGRLFDGTRIDEPGVQEVTRGVRLRTRENFSPIVSRGILLDFPTVLEVERVPQDYVITPTELDRALSALDLQIRPGDTVLIRTGWDTIAHDNDEYNRMPIPGPDGDTARRLVDARIVATGADTMPYENAPGATPLEVHVELLPKAGIFIFEMMDLRELAASGAREFLFIAAPLRIAGATGSPINPLAVLAA
ncbi:cyclase family protein [Microbacterium sp.]|uniref:cyclase family protein n=1 Tax=Microbacterium sp. TaxID=51671 RepID=UPI003A867074